MMWFYRPVGHRGGPRLLGIGGYVSSAAAMAITAAFVAWRIEGFRTSGQLDSLTATVRLGTWTMMLCPWIPVAWNSGSSGSVTHQQLR